MVCGKAAFSEVPSTFREESENRKYQPTAQVITAGSKWRHLNKPAVISAYQQPINPHPGPLLQLCNTTVFLLAGTDDERVADADNDRLC